MGQEDVCKDCTTVKVLRSQFDDLKADNSEEHKEIKMKLDELSKMVQAHAVKIGQGAVVIAVIIFLSNVIGTLIVKLLVH